MPERKTIEPPVAIYDYVEIADRNGHICTAENPAIAAKIVEILNGAPQTAGLTGLQVLAYVKLAILRVRDDRILTNDGMRAVLDGVAKHLHQFQKDNAVLAQDVDGG